jgi:hypothetical protein
MSHSRLRKDNDEGLGFCLMASSLPSASAPIVCQHVGGRHPNSSTELGRRARWRAATHLVHGRCCEHELWWGLVVQWSSWKQVTHPENTKSMTACDYSVFLLACSQKRKVIITISRHRCKLPALPLHDRRTPVRTPPRWVIRHVSSSSDIAHRFFVAALDRRTAKFLLQNPWSRLSM